MPAAFVSCGIVRSLALQFVLLASYDKRSHLPLQPLANHSSLPLSSLNTYPSKIMCKTPDTPLALSAVHSLRLLSNTVCCACTALSHIQCLPPYHVARPSHNALTAALVAVVRCHGSCAWRTCLLSILIRYFVLCILYYVVSVCKVVVLYAVMSRCSSLLPHRFDHHMRLPNKIQDEAQAYIRHCLLF